MIDLVCGFCSTVLEHGRLYCSMTVRTFCLSCRSPMVDGLVLGFANPVNVTGKQWYFQPGAVDEHA